MVESLQEGALACHSFFITVNLPGSVLCFKYMLHTSHCCSIRLPPSDNKRRFCNLCSLHKRPVLWDGGNRLVPETESNVPVV